MNITIKPKEKKDDLWAEKYRPKTIDDIIGNKENIEKMKKWLTDFKSKIKGTPKLMLISGEPGIGKTSSAHVILKHFGYNVIEHNASDIRGSRTINDVIKRSLSYTNIIDIMNGCQKPIAIIMDEIDNLVNGGPERGGMSAFIDIIKSDIDVKTRGKKKDKLLIYNPIICIYNEFSNKKLTELRKYAINIEFKPPTREDIEPFLDKVLENEKIRFDFEAKQELINMCDCDIRRLMNLLQYINSGFIMDDNNLITYENMMEIKDGFGNKDKSFYLKEEIIDFFSNEKNIEETLELAKKDQFKVPLYIYEHSLSFLKYKLCTCEEKVNMYYDILDAFTKNDIIQTVIFLNHFRELNKYSSIYGCSTINKIMSRIPYENSFKNFKPNITYPCILTKISQKGSNKKMIIKIINDLKHIKINFTFNTIKILCEFIYNQLFVKATIKALFTLCNYMKRKNIKLEDLDTILKLHKFHTIVLPKSKKLPKKRKDNLKQIYEQVINQEILPYESTYGAGVNPLCGKLVKLVPRNYM